MHPTMGLGGAYSEASPRYYGIERRGIEAGLVRRTSVQEARVIMSRGSQYEPAWFTDHAERNGPYYTATAKGLRHGLARGVIFEERVDIGYSTWAWAQVNDILGK